MTVDRVRDDDGSSALYVCMDARLPHSPSLLQVSFEREKKRLEEAIREVLRSSSK